MSWKDKTGTASTISRERQMEESMKRIILLLLSLLVVFFSSCEKGTVQQSNSDQGDTNKAESVVTKPLTATETGPVFRNVNWGMTPEEVRAVETAYYKGSGKIAVLVKQLTGGKDDYAARRTLREMGLMDILDMIGLGDVLFFELELFDRHCVLAYTFNNSKQLILAAYLLKYISNRYETYQEILTMLTEKYGTPDEEAAYSAVWHTSRCNIELLLRPSNYKSLAIAYMEPEAAAQFKQERQKERKKNKEAL